MKKIYAIWCKVNLTKKPDWLDAFRKKYNYLYEFHITLKQPCFIDESDLPEIKSIVSEVISEFNQLVGEPNHKIDVEFEKIVADLEDKSIMILAKENKMLMDLQYKIRTTLKVYSNYRKPILKLYETNFKPHLTIAMGLTNKFDQAVLYVGKDTKCVGEITEIILSCVKEDTSKEAKNPKNLSIFKL